VTGSEACVPRRAGTASFFRPAASRQSFDRATATGKASGGCPQSRAAPPFGNGSWPDKSGMMHDEATGFTVSWRTTRPVTKL
jgi:hypothetical protein